jgi:hypothetical protein
LRYLEVASLIPDHHRGSPHREASNKRSELPEDPMEAGEGVSVS